MWGGLRQVSFGQEFAKSYGAPLSEMLIVGPHGGAIMELLCFITVEGLNIASLAARPITSISPSRAIPVCL